MKKAVLGLCVLVLFASGCASAGIYKVGKKSYALRSEAEAAQRKILKEILEECRTAHGPVAKECVLVKPSWPWIEKNYAKVVGIGLFTRENLKSYAGGGNLRQVETEYEMIKKSGLFEDCKIITAPVGNGDGENLAPKEAFEIRAERDPKKYMRWYRLYAPGGKYSRQLSPTDIYNFGTMGWDWLADEIVKLKEKE